MSLKLKELFHHISARVQKVWGEENNQSHLQLKKKSLNKNQSTGVLRLYTIPGLLRGGTMNLEVFTQLSKMYQDFTLIFLARKSLDIWVRYFYLKILLNYALKT